MLHTIALYHIVWTEHMDAVVLNIVALYHMDTVQYMDVVVLNVVALFQLSHWGARRAVS